MLSLVDSLKWSGSLLSHLLSSLLDWQPSTRFNEFIVASIVVFVRLTHQSLFNLTYSHLLSSLLDWQPSKGAHEFIVSFIVVFIWLKASQNDYLFIIVFIYCSSMVLFIYCSALSFIIYCYRTANFWHWKLCFITYCLLCFFILTDSFIFFVLVSDCQKQFVNTPAKLVKLKQH
jgi:hypothetical protein